MKDVKCPVCGCNISETLGDSKFYVTNRLKYYSPKTRRLLKAVGRICQNILPSQDIHAFKNFLFKIEGMQETAIQKGCTIYLDGKFINQGKGLSYLFGIIKIQDKDNVKLKELERKTIGSSPKEYKDESTST